MVPAAVAALVVLAGRLLGWRGVDVAAQVYRADSFRRNGFALWDFSWYGGHWTLDYSLLYPPLAASLGLTLVAVASAGLSALAFSRLVRGRLGPGGPAAELVFAVGTVVPAAIGQLTFLAGTAAGLSALWAASRRRWALAVAAAVLTPLLSPLAGAFLALAAAAWAFAGPGGARPGCVALAVAACGPVVAAALLFPGDGPMPYPKLDCGWEVAVALAVAALAGRRHREVMSGAALVAAAALGAELVPTALGGNIGRIEDLAALPLGLALVWERGALLAPRAVGVPLAAVVSVPLVLSQWAPAWGAITSAPTAASTSPAFFAPLDRQLALLSAAGPAGRVEVVPTAYHWEAAYVAPVLPLARGWERQLDVALNPLFYRPRALTAASYRQWLLANGVLFVALPTAPLDQAGRAEGALVASGRVPGLVPVWSSPSWRLYRVAGSSGIVSGPAVLVSAGHDRLVLAASGAGVVTVREHAGGVAWSVAGGVGCLSPDRAGWLRLAVPGPERVVLSPGVIGGSGCELPES